MLWSVCILAGLESCNLNKNNSNTGVFLRILQNICAQMLLCIASPLTYFCMIGALIWNGITILTGKKLQKKLNTRICKSRIFATSNYFLLSQLTLTNHGILHYLWSADLSKWFSQLIWSIFTFLNQYFSPIFIFAQYFFNLLTFLKFYDAIKFD